MCWEGSEEFSNIICDRGKGDFRFSFCPIYLPKFNFSTINIHCCCHLFKLKERKEPMKRSAGLASCIAIQFGRQALTLSLTKCRECDPEQRYLAVHLPPQSLLQAGPPWFFHLTFVCSPGRSTLPVSENAFPEAVGKRILCHQNNNFQLSFH